MLSDRRLGRNLKGMNKSNMTEIENSIWSSIDREIQLYQNGLEYNKEKESLQEMLRVRKLQILKEMRNLECRSN